MIVLHMKTLLNVCLTASQLGIFDKYFLKMKKKRGGNLALFKFKKKAKTNSNRESFDGDKLINSN